jgi:hypothetical protein
MGSEAFERFHAAVTASAVSAGLHAAWTGATPDPEPGQIWRVRVDDIVELVLLVTVTDRSVTAAPATIDADYADDQALTVPADASPLGVATTVWLGLTDTVPMRTLDRCAGRLTPDNADVPTAVRGIGQPGAAVVSAAQPVAEYRARLAACMYALATVSSDIPGTGELPSLLRAAGVKPGRLAEFGMETPRALAVARGTAAVNEHEAGALATELDRTVEDILAANPAPPAELVTWLDRPRRRPKLEQLARQRGISTEEARLHAAYDLYALAAREPGGSIDWNARLDRYFELALDE